VPAVPGPSPLRLRHRRQRCPVTATAPALWRPRPRPAGAAAEADLDAPAGVQRRHLRPLRLDHRGLLAAIAGSSATRAANSSYNGFPGCGTPDPNHNHKPDVSSATPQIIRQCGWLHLPGVIGNSETNRPYVENEASVRKAFNPIWQAKQLDYQVIICENSPASDFSFETGIKKLGLGPHSDCRACIVASPKGALALRRAPTRSGEAQPAGPAATACYLEGVCDRAKPGQCQTGTESRDRFALSASHHGDAQRGVVSNGEHTYRR
jgi:hypothetical protein